MKAVLVVGLMAVAAASAEARQDQLDAAKDLYASAAYEEALSTLSRLSEGGVAAPAVARQVDEYRAFCLYALGRTAEAESMAESIIRREPLAELNTADASPRVEAMFAGVRKRVLPSLIRDQYPDDPRIDHGQAICGRGTPVGGGPVPADDGGTDRRVGRAAGGHQRARRRIPGARARQRVTRPRRGSREGGDGRSAAAGVRTGGVRAGGERDDRRAPHVQRRRCRRETAHSDLSARAKRAGSNS